MKPDIIEIVKVLFSLGLISSLSKFIIDRILSTKVEIELETNYGRAFREIFNFIVFLLILSLYVFLFVGIFYSPKNQNYDVLTAGHMSVTPEDVDKWLNQEKNNNLFISLLLLGIFLVFIAYIYSVARSFWYNNYKRKVYLEYSMQSELLKLFVVKRLSKDRVLLANEEQTLYQIKSLSSLEDMYFKTESFIERRKRRYKSYYETVENRVKWNKMDTPTKIIMIVLSILLGVIILVGTLVQENKFIFLVILIIIFSVVFFYVRNQYKKGKLLIMDDKCLK
ncbi:hypothetical protein JZO73_11620 [Enterococcus plantarum]|uniref:hypothetical protein n=1 Tax=Enterococcus plantarum TaxID=1077675 RepID=UPI001A8EC129|nr:hypothetical protein [Enterococcus plantarum]MBO0468176.1 hypothetical protein [Enterococcus plantarum]